MKPFSSITTCRQQIMSKISSCIHVLLWVCVYVYSQAPGVAGNVGRNRSDSKSHRVAWVLDQFWKTSSISVFKVHFRARHGSCCHLYHQHDQYVCQHPFKLICFKKKKILLCVFSSCKPTCTQALRTHTPAWCKKFFARSFVFLHRLEERKKCEAFWCFLAAVNAGGVWKTSRVDETVGGPFLDLCMCLLCVVSTKYHNKAYGRDFALRSSALTSPEIWFHSFVMLRVWKNRHTTPGSCLSFRSTLLWRWQWCTVYDCLGFLLLKRLARNQF